MKHAFGISLCLTCIKTYCTFYHCNVCSHFDIPQVLTLHHTYMRYLCWKNTTQCNDVDSIFFICCCNFNHSSSSVSKMGYNAETEQGRRALQPLAGGFYAIVWGIIGSTIWTKHCIMNKTLHLPRSTSQWTVVFMQMCGVRATDMDGFQADSAIARCSVESWWVEALASKKPLSCFRISSTFYPLANRSWLVTLQVPWPWPAGLWQYTKPFGATCVAWWQCSSQFGTDLERHSVALFSISSASQIQILNQICNVWKKTACLSQAPWKGSRGDMFVWSPSTLLAKVPFWAVQAPRLKIVF